VLLDKEGLNLGAAIDAERRAIAFLDRFLRTKEKGMRDK